MVGQPVNHLFNELYNKTYGIALRYVTVKCGNTNDIADILQEIYLEVYRVLTQKGDGYIQNSEAFVLRLAKIKVYRHYTLTEKLRQFLPLHVTADDGDEIEPAEWEQALQSPMLEDEVIARLTADEIWNAIRRKPPDVQKIFILYYSGECKLSEIAATLHMTESNVKHKLYRTL